MTTLTPDSDSTSSPVARFGAELRRLRRLRGWTQEKLGGLLGYSDTWISLIERGKETPTSKLALKADEVFETGGVFVELLRRITGAALLEGFEDFADCEARCRKLRSFKTSVIPGLFQTPEYAAALAAAAVRRGSITQDQADERVAFLVARQHRVLERPNPPIIHTVMDESCVTRLVGGPPVMARQLDHVAALAERPNITVQVAPLSLGEMVPFIFPVVLLTLADRSLVGYSETHARGYLERNSTTCAAWARDYDQLQVESLSTVASLARISNVRKGLQ
ncbi:Scr1 family TA system antitoxin-like transcriptional regulator [Kitasatospora aureofaciens]|uniref:helix-turn-helix domain-containing protein n=1 Tax=Kitasatospora aureofaciens TaxID=1894 RepID=UPI0034074479